MRKLVSIILLFMSIHLLASEDKILSSQEALNKYKLEIKKIEALKLPEDAKKIDDIKRSAFKQLGIDLENARLQDQKKNDKRHELAKNFTTKEEWRKFYIEEKIIFEVDKKTWDEYYAILMNDLNEVENISKLQNAEMKLKVEALAKTRIALDILLKEAQNMVTIDSSSHLGGAIGSIKKDQTISIQYKFGKWSPNSLSMLSPDEIKNLDNAQNYDAGIFSIKEDNSVELITRIPINTQEKNFIFKFEKDYAKLAIRICEGLLPNELIDNKGSVVYEVLLPIK